MVDNFFLDNQDLQFRLDHLDLSEVVEIKEKGYRYNSQYPTAPRSYRDAMHNYHLMLEVLGEICAQVIAPLAAEADEQGAQFHDGQVEYALPTQAALRALQQSGLNGAMLPWEHGGLNLPESIYQIMVELVSRAEAGLMTIFGLQEIASVIEEFADEETKERFLPRFSRGEVSGAMVLTEPDAGSDLGAVQTRATFDDATGQWHINGVKRFITNGNAAVHMVLARSEEGSSDARGLSLFVLERDDSVRIRRIENKMGLHASPTCEVQYSNTPATLVGKRRYGLMRYAMAMMNGARLAVSAQAVGIAEAAYREAQRYASQRVQFKQPICKLPAVSRMLVSMRTEIEAARALLFETGLWVDRMKSYDRLLADAAAPDAELRQRQKQAANMAETLTPLSKYFATEMGNRVCYLAMQIHGGVGYMREFNIERHYRDIRVTSIYEGASQMQVVAATGKLLGHALDPLLETLSSQDCPPDLADLHQKLVEANTLFLRATDALKEKEREIIDFFAIDLVDMAAYLLTAWLLLQDAAKAERKKGVVRAYLAEHLPQMHSLAERILAADATPLQVRETVLSCE
ncbi:MAG: acyl-CoA dehydrogenase family protein [Anaerolineales bacterium]|nr:acyl-CoA dehydrogenase family protein [Anaerolineales bacterium]